MLEEYFDFQRPDDIRMKGSRIGIESVLYAFLYHAQSPEAIQEIFPILTLEQIYAAILYYLRNKQNMDRYVAEWLEFSRQARREQRSNPPAAIVRLSQLKAEIAASGLTVEQYLQEHQSGQAAEQKQLTAAA